MRIFPFVCIFVLLCGCTAHNSALNSSASSSAVSSLAGSSSSISVGASSSIAQNMDQNTYLTYHEGVEGAGRPVLLFFYSPDTAGDPFSQQTHKILTDLYRTGTYILPTYRADFTKAVTAQRKYHVLLPDTIVLVDAEGREVARQLHPTEAHIKDFLTRFKTS